MYYTAAVVKKNPVPRRATDISRHLTRAVIPYVTEGVDRHADLIAAASIIFIGGGELAELPAMLQRLKRPPFTSAPVLLHIDLVNGLANDESGLRYVATLDGVDGI